MIFKYNANAKYSTKDLKGSYSSNKFHFWMYTWMKKDHR